MQNLYSNYIIIRNIDRVIILYKISMIFVLSILKLILFNKIIQRSFSALLYVEDISLLQY